MEQTTNTRKVPRGKNRAYTHTHTHTHTHTRTCARARKHTQNILSPCFPQSQLACVGWLRVGARAVDTHLALVFQVVDDVIDDLVEVGRHVRGDSWCAAALHSDAPYRVVGW